MKKSYSDLDCIGNEFMSQLLILEISTFIMRTYSISRDEISKLQIADSCKIQQQPSGRCSVKIPFLFSLSYFYFPSVSFAKDETTDSDL